MSSNTTVQTITSPPEVLPSNVHDASDFQQYGMGIIPSHPEEDRTWTGNFEDPLLGLLQSNDTKLISTEWMDTDTLGFLAHQDESLVAQPHDLPLTPPTTIGSLPTNTEDSWIPGCDHPSEFSHAESFAGDTMPPSPEATSRSSESAAQRLVDLQSLLFSRHITRAQDADGLTTLINTTLATSEAERGRTTIYFTAILLDRSTRHFRLRHTSSTTASERASTTSTPTTKPDSRYLSFYDKLSSSPGFLRRTPQRPEGPSSMFTAEPGPESRQRLQPGTAIFGQQHTQRKPQQI
ncbi:hypothetical protein HER10_EVM0009212 [Colletotrichum scovillei]|uniref:uncharacterized protein n=1 Tax=Colletotrichum scovillei TaxID=1209932 RepID=UPI0015C3ECCD|nr:uncharacterized protein HER10_EVM0009212 [Colletotrichum scovillei]KAF4775321.1 hypothetical protein HER10_EVM0009212 [Colletotrichum scovillei]